MSIHTPIAPVIPPLPAELEAMSRHWDAMADSLLDFTTDTYEFAKARFWDAQAQLAGRERVN